jgi:hypothetical protein
MRWEFGEGVRGWKGEAGGHTSAACALSVQLLPSAHHESCSCASHYRALSPPTACFFAVHKLKSMLSAIHFKPMSDIFLPVFSLSRSLHHSLKVLLLLNPTSLKVCTQTSCLAFSPQANYTPTEQPPFVGEILCQLLRIEGCRVVSSADPARSLISVF